jgi:hypothetical protein
MAKPKIYVFCNQKGCDGRGDWHNGIAIAEDGTGLAGHVSSNHYFLRSDLGDGQLGYDGFRREEYGKHYPDGYEVMFLEGDEITRVVSALPKPLEVSDGKPVEAK